MDQLFTVKETSKIDRFIEIYTGKDLSDLDNIKERQAVLHHQNNRNWAEVFYEELRKEYIKNQYIYY